MPQSKKDKRKKALARLEANVQPHVNQDLRVKQFPRSPEARQAEIETLRAKTR